MVVVNKGFLGVDILVDILEILEILDTKPLWIFVNVYEYEFIWAIFGEPPEHGPTHTV